MEEWRKVSDKGAVFLVSSLGRIKMPPLTYVTKRGSTTRGERFLSLASRFRGYVVVGSGPRRKRKMHFVHRMVARAFLKGEFPAAVVNHIDGNKAHNLPHNLEWVTRSENTKHAWETGLVACRGEDHPFAKLTAAQVSNIRERPKESVDNLAAEFAVTPRLIYGIRAREFRKNG